MESVLSLQPSAFGPRERPLAALESPPESRSRASRRARRFALCLMVIGAAAAASAQTPVFRSGTDAVRVDVLVADSRGSPISRLGPRDFELRDNGVAQQIVAASFEELPLHVVLALDTSGSVEGESFERLVAAAVGLLEQLRPADAATLVAFSNAISLQPLADDRVVQAEVELRRLQAAGFTSVFDATWTSLMSADRPGYRSLVVLLSDGFDNQSWLELDDVLEAAKRVEGVVYCVRVQPLASPVPAWLEHQRRKTFAATVPAGSRKFLELIAEETGGRVLRADTDVDVRPALLRVLEEFRRRYVLTYVPEGVAPAGWHALAVTVRGRAATVTARRGYQREWPASR